jgi:hypothetical protein
VTRIGELGTTLAVTSSSILVTLMKEAPSSSETSVLTRVTRRNIPEDAILHSHRHENLKSHLSFHVPPQEDMTWSYGRPWPIGGVSFTFLYVDDVRTSQETHPYILQVL